MWEQLSLLHKLTIWTQEQKFVFLTSESKQSDSAIGLKVEKIQISEILEKM